MSKNRLGGKPPNPRSRQCPYIAANGTTLPSSQKVLLLLFIYSRFCRGGVWGHHAPKRSALIYKLIWLKTVTQTARIIMWATIRWTVQALGLYIFTGMFWCAEILFSKFWHHHWIHGGQLTYIAYALREGIHCFGYARKRRGEGTSIVQPFN